MMCKVKQTPGIHNLFLSLLRCSRVGHEEMSMDGFSTPDIHLLGMHCRHYLIIHPERVLSTIQYIFGSFTLCIRAIARYFFVPSIWEQGYFSTNVVSFSTVFGRFTNPCSVHELKLEGHRLLVVCEYLLTTSSWILHYPLSVVYYSVS